jgi:hypothetical protein
MDGRGRDRTAGLYRVKVGPVIYVIDSSSFSLHDSGSFLMIFGAYCSQLVPKFLARQTRYLCLNR